MVAMLISFIVVFLSFNFFMVSYQINGVNRLITGAPLSLFETAIVLYDIEENGPYFDKEILEDNLTSFFDYHLPRYVSQYSLSFYYYNIENHSINMTDEPKAVEVTFQAELVLDKHYQKTMYYEIRSN
ncbi:MAG: hypothetical protein IJR08_01490 [Bacilli bacterium]|nr:hypothetical protein [Bacilli bacterium]